MVEKFAHIELHPRRVDNVHMGLVFEELIRKGKPQPDSALRDTENVPLSEDVQAWFEREGAAPRPRRLDRPRQDPDRL